MQDRLRRIVGKPEDVTAVSQNLRLLPGEQHLAILGDLVLLLLGAEQAFRIDVLESDKDALDAGARTFLDKVRQTVAQSIDLNDEIELQTFAFAKLNHPIENRLPILVARKVVVRDKETMDALPEVRAHDSLAII